MHSSRVRTVYCSGHLLGGGCVCPGGCLSRGKGSVYPAVCVYQGGGVSARGGESARHPPREQNHRQV